MQKFMFLLIIGIVHGEHDWKIVSTGILQEIPDVLVYQATVPSVFQISLPESFVEHRSETCSPINSINTCALDKAIHTLSDDIEEEILEFQAAKHMSKRQIGFLIGGFAGMFLSPVVNKITHSLFGDDNEIKRAVNQVQQHVTDTQKSVVRFEKVFNNLTSILTKKMDFFNTRMNALIDEDTRLDKEEQLQYILIDAMYNLFAKHLLSEQISASIQRCKNNLLPHRLISSSQLMGNIMEVQKQLSTHNFSLAFDPNNVKQLANLPIAECMFSKETVFVILNLPIVKTPVELWKVYHIIPTKFAHYNQTCALDFSDNDYVAATSATATTIVSGPSNHCDAKNVGMCLISSHSKETANSQHCAAGLLKSLDLNELAKTCQFKCDSNQQLSYKMINQNRILFTNVHTLEVICPARRETFDFTNLKLGAVDVTLQCNCSMVADNVYIPPVFPCFELAHTDIDGFEVTRILPDLWTTLKVGVGSRRQLHFQNVNEYYNGNWSTKFPSIKVKVDDFLPEQKLPFNEQYGINVTEMVLTISLAFVVLINIVMWKKLIALTNKLQSLTE